jgi:type IV pilus assembly protein PilA
MSIKHSNRTNRQKGFSLIELLIVVAIILVIAAIAIPSFVRSKQAASMSSMAASMRTLTTALRNYETQFPNGLSTTAPANFAAVVLNNLGNGGTAGACLSSPPPTPTQACIIDDVLSSGVKGDYNIVLTVPFSADGNTYQFQAQPSNQSSSYGQGLKWYQFDASGVLTYSTNQGTSWQTL